jgi:hypothetical protein
MKTFFILAGIGLVCLLLVVRLFFAAQSGQEKEREWFVRSLGYEFSVAVDSVQQYRRSFVNGRITAGKPRLYREDSLKNSLTKHGNLLLVTSYRNDSIRFAVEIAGGIRKGDSIRISSKENSITVFRFGKQVASTPFSGALNGWGKPPFRTK